MDPEKFKITSEDRFVSLDSGGETHPYSTFEQAAQSLAPGQFIVRETGSPCIQALYGPPDDWEPAPGDLIDHRWQDSHLSELTFYGYILDLS